MSNHPTELLSQLTQDLWTDRQLVELLLFKLVEAQLLLAADETRFVPSALSEVEAVMERIRDAEDDRASTVAELATEWQVAGGTLTLNEIVRRAPEPHASMLDEHRSAFRRLTDEIEQVTRENRRLATDATGRVKALLEGFVGATATYDAAGRTADGFHRPMSLDEVM